MLASFFVSLPSGAPDWVNFVLIAAAFLGSLGFLMRWAWTKVIKPAVKVSEVVPPLTRLAEVAPQLQAVAQIATILERIAGQFENNGGSTMRDRVDEIVRSVARVETTVSDHSAAIQTLTTAAAKQLTHADETRANLAELAPHPPTD